MPGVLLFEEEKHLGFAEELHGLSSLWYGKEEPRYSEVVSRLQSTAKTAALVYPVEAASSSVEALAGISPSCPIVAIPAAEDYCKTATLLWA